LRTGDVKRGCNVFFIDERVALLATIDSISSHVHQLRLHKETKDINLETSRKDNKLAGAKDWGSGSGDGSKENKMAPDKVRKAGLRFCHTS
jgi:hypothetical protein